MELKHYLELLRRWAWLLILGLALGAIGGFVGSLYQTPVYQASTRILTLRASQSTSSDLTYLNDQQLVQTYIQLLTTKPVLDAASTQLGFQINVDQLRVQQVGTTPVIQLSVEDNDPARSASIANTLVQALLDQNENLQSGRYTATEQSLQAQIGQVQTQIASLQTQISDVSTATVQDQLAQVQNQISTLQSQVTALQTEMDKLKRIPTQENLAKIAADQAQLNQLQPILDLYQQINTNLVVLGKPVEGGQGSNSTRLSQLQSTLSLYQQIYINLLNSQASVRLARLQNTPNAVQIDQAVVPVEPVRPRPLTNTLLAGLIGLMLAGGIAFLIEYLDDTIKTPEDVERLLGLSVIGYIAKMQYPDNSDEGIYVVRQPRSPVSEAFRSLRTNLEFSSVDKPLRSLLVTSSSPNEGKTTVAVNLAAIIAQGGRQVALLDADLRKPQVHHFLNLPNRAGLSDLFRGSIPPAMVSQKLDGLEGVSVITSGSLPPNPTELLASARMNQILNELDETVEMLILDSPPSLVSDIQVLASKVDGVLLVVQPGHTQAQDARATLEQLNRAGARLVGVIFNRIPRDRPYYYGGYRHYSPYYNGGYHYYSGNHRELTDQTEGKTASNLFSRWFTFSGNGKSHTKSNSEEEALVKPK